MKKKQIVDLIINTILVLIGVVLLILPMFGIKNIHNIFFILMIVYAILDIVQFILTYESHDYEGLYCFVINLGIGITGLSFSFSNPMQLALCILCWTVLTSMAKLIKTNYYNDKRDRMYKLRLFTLASFFLLGVLTSVTIYNSDFAVSALGFFFYTNGVLEMIDPIVKYLLS